MMKPTLEELAMIYESAMEKKRVKDLAEKTIKDGFKSIDSGVEALRRRATFRLIKGGKYEPKN